MARSSSVMSTRAMALGTLTPRRNTSQLADFCSAQVAGFCSAVDNWAGLCRFLVDGRIEMDNNTVERTIRPIALNRKNALFAGHDAGAANWATIASLVETCKLNAIEPHAYLTGTLHAIVNGHKQSQIDDLLPWNCAAKV